MALVIKLMWSCVSWWSAAASVVTVAVIMCWRWECSEWSSFSSSSSLSSLSPMSTEEEETHVLEQRLRRGSLLARIRSGPCLRELTRLVQRAGYRVQHFHFDASHPLVEKLALAWHLQIAHEGSHARVEALVAFMCQHPDLVVALHDLQLASLDDEHNLRLLMDELDYAKHHNQDFRALMVVGTAASDAMVQGDRPCFRRVHATFSCAYEGF